MAAARLSSWNAVVTANTFNPTVLSSAWLIRQGIVPEEDTIGPASFFSAALMQLATTQYVLSVNPTQLQLATHQIEGSAAIVNSTIGRIVELLEHTPFVACGVNFVWWIHALEQPIEQVTRTLFARPGSVYDRFADSDARFGAYLSRDIAGGRLKLDIRPAATRNLMPNLQPLVQGDYFLQFAFNFHKDATSHSAIKDHLAKWDEFRGFAEEAISGFEIK